MRLAATFVSLALAAATAADAPTSFDAATATVRAEGSRHVVAPLYDLAVAGAETSDAEQDGDDPSDDERVPEGVLGANRHGHPDFARDLGVPRAPVATANRGRDPQNDLQRPPRA